MFDRVRWGPSSSGRRGPHGGKLETREIVCTRTWTKTGKTDTVRIAVVACEAVGSRTFVEIRAVGPYRDWPEVKQLVADLGQHLTDTLGPPEVS